MTANWRNWAGNQAMRPARVVEPGSPAAVAEAVRSAVADGLRVRAVGSGHSFTGAALTDGCLLRMSGMARLVSADAGTGLVTVQAGAPIRQLNRQLDAFGLAMVNLGDIDAQTISGAISTGTHGTGAGFGGLATQVRALELALADGSVVSCSADERPKLFTAARVGLGALGVVTSMALQCVPAFRLHAAEGPMPLDRVLDELDALADGNDHFEFYWFPHTQVALTKRNNRVPEGTPARPLGRFRGWLDDEFLANSVFGVVNRVCSAVPRVTRVANNVSAHALSAREYVDASYRVFTSPRRVRFVEMEYAVPRHTLADVLREIRAWVAATREPLPFPVEVRFAAADDVWLSTAFDRETAYVAVHQYPSMPYRRYFAAVERIVAGVGGRPHWGKLHGLDAARLGELYPHLDDFVALRDELDPTGVFDNTYLRKVLGATAS